MTSEYWDEDINNVWETFFKWNNKEILLTDWLYKSVLPRPRDMIRFIQDAIEIAINREHTEIHEDDLDCALNSYSAFALNQIVAEYKAEEPWIEDFSNSLTGEKSILPYTSLITKIKQNGTELLELQQIINRIITLISINFLGVKLNGSPINYANNIQESNKLKSIIRNTALSNQVQFVIHPVFYRHLNIRKEDDREKFSFMKLLKVLKLTSGSKN